MVVMAKKATLHRLQTVYSLRDLYDLVEMVTVEQHNERVVAEYVERRNPKGD